MKKNRYVILLLILMVHEDADRRTVDKPVEKAPRNTLIIIDEYISVYWADFFF
jgi:hypothetical protein